MGSCITNLRSGLGPSSVQRPQAIACSCWSQSPPTVNGHSTLMNCETSPAVSGFPQFCKQQECLVALGHEGV